MKPISIDPSLPQLAMYISYNSYMVNNNSIQFPGME